MATNERFEPLTTAKKQMNIHSRLRLTALLACAAISPAGICQTPVATGARIATAPPATLPASAPSAAAANIVTTRDAIVIRELLTSVASQVNAADARSQATQTLIGQEVERFTWIAGIGIAAAICLAGLAGFGGFQYSRYLSAKREQEKIDAGKEPMSALVHRTRDEATRLAQRLQMAGLTETRLFKSIMDALPALQVEAGKATFNLKKQIPKSQQATLEGPVAPLDPLRAAPGKAIPLPKTGAPQKSTIAAKEISVAALAANAE